MGVVGCGGGVVGGVGGDCGYDDAILIVMMVWSDISNIIYIMMLNLFLVIIIMLLLVSVVLHFIFDTCYCDGVYDHCVGGDDDDVYAVSVCNYWYGYYGYANYYCTLMMLMSVVISVMAMVVLMMIYIVTMMIIAIVSMIVWLMMIVLVMVMMGGGVAWGEAKLSEAERGAMKRREVGRREVK